jgi:inositol transport system substrate-binding protein
MKKTFVVAGFAALMSTSAMAETIGVSMALFDDNFLTVLRNGIQKSGDEMGVTVQTSPSSSTRSTTSSPRASTRSS